MGFRAQKTAFLSFGVGKMRRIAGSFSLLSKSCSMCGRLHSLALICATRMICTHAQQ